MVNVPWCHDCDRPEGICECEAMTPPAAPDEPMPMTAEQLTAAINALPKPLRAYIHDLESDADPAGDKQRLWELEQLIPGLQATITSLETKLAQSERALAEARNVPSFEQVPYTDDHGTKWTSATEAAYARERARAESAERALKDEVAKAVEAEREGNAYIAETYAPPDDTYPMTPYGVGNAIAKAIRSRGEGESK